MTRAARTPAPLPQGEAKVKAVTAMFDAIAPRYDTLNRILTFGLDVAWRKRTVRALGLPPGSLVVDLAAGTGDLCRDLESAGHRPVGLDLSAGMLAHARTSAPMILADALRTPLRDSSLDGATCGFALRNLPDLRAFFTELGRIVRPGGRVALLEVAQPANRLLRAGHAVYFQRVVPKIGGWLSDAAAYRYLPASVAYLPEPPVLLEWLAAAGFEAVDRRLLAPGAAQLVTATRQGARP